MQTRHGPNTTSTPLWAFGLVLALGVAMVTLVRMAIAANNWGPPVGSIVSFTGARPVLAPVVRFPARRANTGAYCVLNSARLRAAGGSLIVEAVQPGRRHGYLVHWAGAGPTSARSDCGRDAELRLSGADVGSLATAAGGFGVGQRSMLPLLGGG
ncbi:MAG: hypothetical protein ACP5NP_09890 [Acetobacteraceae bacterium]